MGDVEIKKRKAGNFTIVEISGDVDLYNVGKLKKALFELIDNEEENVQNLAIDMKNVEYMDSSGIGALVASQKKMKVKGGKFVLININEDVLNVLKLSTLDKFFKIYSSEEELLQAEG